MGKSPLLALQSDLPLVAPSLLASDFANLEQEIRRLEAAGARMLHLDVMDGHFVPNITFGVPVVQAIRGVTDLLLDVHLMISEPDRYVEAFHKAGANALTIHIEAVADPVPLLEKIRDLGAAAGISLNPPTPIEAIEKYLDHCDLVLTMSVMPGFGGQHFDPVALEKLRWLRQRVSPETLLSVDGGVNDETIGPCAEAGAQLFVCGTALFDHPDYRHRLGELTTRARSSLGLRV
jgi:ribulose-phosphate 3-epimerase